MNMIVNVYAAEVKLIFRLAQVRCFKCSSRRRSCLTSNPASFPLDTTAINRQAGERIYSTTLINTIKRGMRVMVVEIEDEGSHMEMLARLAVLLKRHDGAQE